MSRRYALDRRTFLRGALGAAVVATIGVPVLEAMLDTNGEALADGTPLPKRFAVWFWGNGTDPDRWAPAVEGADWAPTDMLGGLAPVKDYVNIVSGTTLPVRGRNNPHAEGAVAMLTAGNPVLHPAFSGQMNDWDYLTVPGPSVDEIAAGTLGGGTRRRSVVAAVSRVRTSSLPGTAVNVISHRDPFVYNPPLLDPAAVFDYLFTDGTPVHATADDAALRRARASVLDTVLEDARALEGRLGASDRARLRNHLDGVRDLERRLLDTSAMSGGAACMPPARPDTPVSYRERARLTAEVIAMGFACDLTRVASVEFSCPASQDSFPDVYHSDLVISGEAYSFHEYEHRAGRNDTVRLGLRYFVDLFGEFLAALRARSEGAGNVLDNTCVLGATDISAGESHSFTDYPVLLAGRAGGALRYPGVHVRQPGINTARVAFTGLKSVGVPLDAWGYDQLRVTDAVHQVMA